MADVYLFEELLFSLIKFYGLHILIFPEIQIFSEISHNLCGKMKQTNKQKGTETSNKIITILCCGNTSILKIIHLKLLFGKTVG